MHLVRHDVVEQPLVVRHQHDGALRVAQAVDALGDHLERIDIETRIGFIENGELRLQHQHLQDFVALLLAAGEAFVDAARQKGFAHLHELHLLPDQRQEFVGIDLGFAGGLALGVERRLQQIDIVDAGNFHRVLKAEKQAGARALFGRQRQQVAALEGHRAAGDLVVLAARQHLGERALARAVRSHDGMHLAGVDLEVDALQYVFARDAGAQIGNFKQDRSSIGR